MTRTAISLFFSLVAPDSVLLGRAVQDQMHIVTLLNYTAFGFIVTFLISKRAYVKVKSTWRSEGLYQEESVCCM